MLCLQRLSDTAGMSFGSSKPCQARHLEMRSHRLLHTRSLQLCLHQVSSAQPMVKTWNPRMEFHDVQRQKRLMKTIDDLNSPFKFSKHVSNLRKGLWNQLASPIVAGLPPETKKSALLSWKVRESPWPLSPLSTFQAFAEEVWSPP